MYYKQAIKISSKSPKHYLICYEELEKNLILVKDLQNGEQEEVRLDEFI